MCDEVNYGRVADLEARVQELEDDLEDLLIAPVCTDCGHLSFPPGNHECGS